ncbi:uncharacterized protein Z520_05109 [Fonsecaea multimorphosa CBS 102226]|uniref:MalT-like TPR region domain-containing protein n=1 Tax=Fonsecaea multimorphosa CBS 102226 TaxID=1442371 RepID=A0A0D2KS63_9EURO|nr:uncharacterized protein Z520_05109 [Fonsecaea multimorphosa CBS 102226]KIX99533.1 hypothetical protein Z520_05109 [Fonsecaea multimorphosa CBS 102226]OAL25525.1 hypothetical protein AYO22_04844 [Fonsecaea multimorphosa]
MGNSESKATRLNAQGWHGAQEFLRDGSLKKLQLAVRLLTQAVKVAGPDHPHLMDFYRDQGYWGGFLYERTGDEEAFNMSVDAYAGALSEAGLQGNKRYKSRPDLLMTLGDVFMKRYQMEKTDADLQRAEELYDEAISLATFGDDNHTTCVVSLGSCLLAKFEKTKDPDVLSKAIQCCQDGIEEFEYSQSLVWTYSVLSDCYLAKYKATKSPEDLEEAFQAAQKALDKIPYHSDGLNALTKCLLAKFEQTQSLRDIEEAIAKATTAADNSQLCRPQWEESLKNVGDCLDAKYAKTKKQKDLNDCIDFHEEMVKILCLADPARAHSFHMLCGLRFERYQRGKAGQVLLQAISEGEQGASVVWPGWKNPERALLLDLLASCYGAKLARKDLAGKSLAKDLERAISCCGEALKIMGTDDPRREKTANKLKTLKVEGFYEEPPEQITS